MANAFILKVATRYSATGAPNVDAVRKIVASLGIGKTVDVKTTSSKRLRGKIESIEQDGFTIVHGLKASTDRFEYADVSQVGKAGMRTSYKVLIGAGVAAAVISVLVTLSLIAHAQ